MYTICLTEVGGGQNLNLFFIWLFDNLLSFVIPWEGKIWYLKILFGNTLVVAVISDHQLRNSKSVIHYKSSVLHLLLGFCTRIRIHAVPLRDTILYVIKAQYVACVTLHAVCFEALWIPNSFIHSFGHFYSAPSSPLGPTTQRCFRLQHGYCIGVSRRSAQATAGKGLAQGPYMAAWAGVEPTTLRLKAIDSNKAPPCPSVTAT